MKYLYICCYNPEAGCSDLLLEKQSALKKNYILNLYAKLIIRIIGS